MKDHFLSELDQSWTLFLDRDGVINRKLEDDYVKSLSEFELLPGVLEALYLMEPVFYKIIVVTNQQGIGKGLMTTDNLHWIHQFLLNEAENAGGRIDAIYFCPHLDGLQCSCRKPAPGMAIQAKHDFPAIDFKKSIMVGDSFSDMEFGRRLSMKTVLCTREKRKDSTADLIVSNLKEMADLMKGYQS